MRATARVLLPALLAACAAPARAPERPEQPAPQPTVEPEQPGLQPPPPEPPVQPPVEPEPPRGPDVRYTIELVDPASPTVALHVECAGDADGESDFTLSEGWAGIAETGADLELVEARGLADTVPSERTASNAWRVRHEPEEPLAVVFELSATQHRASAGPPEYYLPILEPGLLHALGAQTLPAPTHLDFAAERPIEIVWRGFEEQGWRTISSFAEGAGPTRVTRSLDAFRHALFVAGEARLFRGDLHGQPVWVAMAGEWSFSDAEFDDLATRIVALGRDFFEDHAKPFYLISLIQVGTGERGMTSLGGTGLTDSFALFMTRNVTLDRAPGGGDVAWLLAHELFHEWNGQAITLEQPEQLGYWFSEGFTDFYARRLLHRGGFLTPAQLVESWNQKLASQAANPERNASAERVREAFWTDPDVGNLPYQRGDVIALMVDHAVRVNSSGARSLDDLMRELVRRSRAGAGPYSNDELLAAIGEFAGAETEAAVRAVALDGADPVLAPDVGGPDLELVEVDVPVFDTGFDHESAVESGVVSGVVPGGSAERAGLVDGMRMRSWSVSFGRVDVPIQVRVGTDSGEQEISFLPLGQPIRGHAFRLRESR
jgi:predicted metalloprotease with PDZ domain